MVGEPGCCAAVGRGAAGRTDVRAPQALEPETHQIEEQQTSRRSAPSPGFLLKRLVLGKPIATARLEHERLGKPTALAIFSSDNMSSVAYATEEILRVLIPAAGVTAFALVLPISAVIVLIEAILIFSYRQTIKAYPTAGGAYIVTKENFGLLPAQVAGVALLTDYVLTVAVSVAAGVQAITSVAPALFPFRIVLSVLFIWLIAYGNLLGVRESGRIFAFPTYIFIVSLYLTVALGLYEVLSGHIRPFSLQHQLHQQPHALTLGAGAVGIFIVMRAFASGGAAVTGVEAISNGVPAFKKPEWKNAQTTLVYMGLVLGGSFLGVSYLVHRLHVIPVADESKSVLAQVGQAIYGTHGIGGFLYLLLQVSTTLILILAANTSFADFPRLASFHAGDAFLPRQFTKRGHKLVFSNGILALAGAATVVVVVFKASVTNLIPLYALGVFTSFTLSQAGMARRHLRLREPGWRTGLLVNGLGAVCTAVVDVIIAIVKFSEGAWMVMLAVPILVAILVRVNRIYEAEDHDLLEGIDVLATSETRPNIAIVMVEAMDQRAVDAVNYALTIRPDHIRAVSISTNEGDEARLKHQWTVEGPLVPLDQIVCSEGDRQRCLHDYVANSAPKEVDVTVIFPAPPRISAIHRITHGRSWSEPANALRGFENVMVVAVRNSGAASGSSGDDRMRTLLTLHPRHRVVILVGRLDRSVIKAIRYARSVDALEVTALHVGVDPEHAHQLLEDWWKFGRALETPLEIHECLDRNIARVVSDYVRALRASASDVSVVLPRNDYSGIIQRLLHDRTSRGITEALREEPRVHIVVVPYQLSAEARGRHLNGEDVEPISH
jgi:amino acid transporter